MKPVKYNGERNYVKEHEARVIQNAIWELLSWQKRGCWLLIQCLLKFFFEKSADSKNKNEQKFFFCS